MTINFQANYGSEPKAIIVVPDPMTGELVETVIPDTSTWYGFGIQPVLALDGFSLGARFEYFHDDDGARTTVPDSNWMNFTITPGYTVDKFTARAEYRLDTISEDVVPRR